MISIIEFVGNILGSIVNILNVRFFDDIPITFLDLLLGAALLKVIFTFVFGGYKEVDIGVSKLGNWSKNKKREISNERRKQQIVLDRKVRSGKYIVVNNNTGEVIKK